MRRTLSWLVALAGLVAPAAEAGGRHPLRDGWRLQSSAELAADGTTLSQPGFATAGWHAIRVPNTVVGALVENGTYPDPYFGMNLRSIPGTSYPIGERFTLLPMPDESPFAPSWWYRSEFTLPLATRGRAVALHFEGINYRANVWFNGERLADAKQVAGAFRRYEFDVTRLARPGEPNALAVEVFAPEPHDLAFMWVDWNPTPADKNMGLWGEVAWSSSGEIALRNPHVVSKLELPSLASARLHVSVEAWNTTEAALDGVVRGAIGEVQFLRRLSLAPRERVTLRFGPDEVPGLAIASPRVWWPHDMGAQPRYTLSLEAEVEGALSDRATLRFGIQEMSSELTELGHRLFRVNGKPVLVLGGGWASDMLLRPASTERLEAELRYVKEMGLNTIRLEGKLETDEFYELADREGILLMPGWCCCDQWEMWDKWDEEDHRVGPASLRDQILRIRNHPSVLVWLNGSDFPPPADVERKYLDVLAELDWSKPILSNATDAPGPLSGPSGVKMRGPYDYVPPSYWLTDEKHGGAFGFATEMGPGPAVPPIESLKRMLPADKLWPMNEVWTFHAGGDEFKDLGPFSEALEARYGKARDAADFARKAQALSYEGERALFEAFRRNSYTATGLIHWMLNDAWPSLIWHLYDYYLRPGGGYFGAKTATRPLHALFSYDDRSVVVVNGTQAPAAGLRVRARLYDLGLGQRFEREELLDVEADGRLRAFEVPKPEGVRGAYLLRLDLLDAGGRRLSRNVYWLSTREDELDWKATKWYYTPTKRHADLTALAALPRTTLGLAAEFEEQPREGRARVRVTNTGSALAFQTRLKLVDPTSGEELLPVYWEDNYLTLFPGETLELAVVYPRARHDSLPRFEAEAWNAATTRSSAP